jgi:RHS repeat-associated protein
MRHLGTSSIVQGVYPTTVSKDNPEAPWPTYPTGPFFTMDRADGYGMGALTVQGVRAYDPGAAQWSTPDAYQGEVHDPMSQRIYMWNGNNPVAYSDPSGYESASTILDGLHSAPGYKPTTDADIYVKGDIGGGAWGVTASVSVTVNVTHPGLFVAGGVGAGTPGGSASLTAGAVTANPGHTTSEMLTGKSRGGTFTALGGAVDHHINGAGSQTGVGVSLGLSATYGYSYGVQLLGGPGAAGSTTILRKRANHPRRP